MNNYLSEIRHTQNVMSYIIETVTPEGVRWTPYFLRNYMVVVFEDCQTKEHAYKLLQDQYSLLLTYRRKREV